MSWEQIAALGRDGFEIASHTRTHTHVDKMKPEQFAEELGYIERRCADDRMSFEGAVCPGCNTRLRVTRTLGPTGWTYDVAAL